MAKNKPRLTPVKVPITLESGQMTSGIRHKNLTLAAQALTPPAGPTSAPVLSVKQAAKLTAQEAESVFIVSGTKSLSSPQGEKMSRFTTIPVKIPMTGDDYFTVDVEITPITEQGGVYFWDVRNDDDDGTITSYQTGNRCRGLWVEARDYDNSAIFRQVIGTDFVVSGTDRADWLKVARRMAR